MRRVLVLLMGLVLASCSKSNDGTAPTASVSASAAAPTASASSARADGGPMTASSSGKAGQSEWTGTYTLVPSSLHIPDSKDYAHVKQAKDDPSKHVGDGTLTLHVEGDRVSGSIDTGPASLALIDGTLIGEEIRGNVRRKTPSDDGLTGTIVAKLASDGAAGSLSLAESNAAILREGKVSLKKK
jgi:hypothetical protein